MAPESAGGRAAEQRLGKMTGSLGTGHAGATAYLDAMPASSRPLEGLFAEMTADPDRPTELPSGVAEMQAATFTEGRLESGVWTCTVGAWDEQHAAAEVMVILEGHVLSLIHI